MKFQEVFSKMNHPSNRTWALQQETWATQAVFSPLSVQGHLLGSRAQGC
jgi:hypothetical protein